MTHIHSNMASEGIDTAIATADRDLSAESLWTGSGNDDYDSNEGYNSIPTGTDKTSDWTNTNTAARGWPTDNEAGGSQYTQPDTNGHSQSTATGLNPTGTSRDGSNTYDPDPLPPNHTSPGDQEPQEPYPRHGSPSTESFATTKENPTATAHTLSGTSGQTATTTSDFATDTSMSKGGSNSIEGKGGGGGGMPTKTKVAIAVPVSIVGALIIAALIFFLLRRRNRQKRNKALPSTDNLIMSTAASTPAQTHPQPYPPLFPSTQPHAPALFAAAAPPAEPSSPRHLSNQNNNPATAPAINIAHDSDSDPIRPDSQLLPPVAGHQHHQQQHQQQQPERHPHAPYHSSRDPTSEQNNWPNAAAETRPRSPFDHPLDDRLSVMSALSDQRAHPHDRDDVSSVSSVSDDEGVARVRPR